MSSGQDARSTRRGVKIGRYEVISHIATGGMGAVYRARDTENDRDVALKVLGPELAAKPVMLERFRREARSASKLRHENIVTVYEFGESAGAYFLAMELIDGIDLHAHVENRGPLPPEEALELVSQACRALDHAHRQAIVHRDIKPSNFLLTVREGKPLVKLTDMGLAREVTADEARVTRAGSTVGTLDYMSPEQARDSGSADIRSDLYSLGGTWFFLLTGQPPFPGGGLGERLLKIMSEEAPDVRGLNPRVSAGAATVIRRLLMKAAEDRYQTPRELLDDLDGLRRGIDPGRTRELPAAPEPVAPSAPSTRTRGERRSTPRPSAPTAVNLDTQVQDLPAPKRRKSRKRRNKQRWWLVGAAAAPLLIGVLVLVLGLRVRRQRQENDVAVLPGPETTEISPDTRPVGTITPPTRKNEADERDLKTTTPTTKPAKPTWRRLYQPARPILATELRSEMEAPWSSSPAPATKPAVFKVCRGKDGDFFPSLSAALAAAPRGKPCVLEVHDAGPLFESALVTDQPLTIRGGGGRRPLIIWDVERAAEERRRGSATEEASAPLIFAEVRGAALTLQGLDLAVQWPETISATQGTLLRVQDGELRADDCSFSQTGQPRSGVALARINSRRPEARCRFSRCVARGSAMTALDLDAPGADVLFDGCLVAGADLPLLQVRTGSERAPTVRAMRSTFVCSQTFLRVLPARPGIDRSPALGWFGWDLLVSRAGNRSGSNLLLVEGGASPDHITWKAVNCLYAGWEHLLAGAQVVPATALRDWHLQWGLVEGDGVVPTTWPAGAAELTDLPPGAFALSAEMPVAYAGTALPGQAIGCDVRALPAGRDNLLHVAIGTSSLPAAEALVDGVPELPVIRDGRFHGGKIDLSTTDLGAFLATQERMYGLGPRVVFHLYGAGERQITPIRLNGSSLVLYFAPPAKKTDKPLVLVPSGAGDARALVEIDGGDLEVVGGTLRLNEPWTDKGAAWLLKVSGGDLRLSSSRLEAVGRTVSQGPGGLIEFLGSGKTAADKAHTFAARRCTFISGRDAIHLEGNGARLLLGQTTVIAGGNAIRVAPGAGWAGDSNLHCVLDRVTVAARDALVCLDAPDANQVAAEPVLIKSRQCALLGPFTGAAAKGTAALRYDHDALARGLVLWHSDHDLFDRRLHYSAATEGSAPVDKNQFVAAWTALWGLPNARHATQAVRLTGFYDAPPWPPDRLVLPREYAGHGAARSSP